MVNMNLHKIINQTKIGRDMGIKKNNWPTISVTIATRNSERTLELCLSSIKIQDYPSDVEIVIADGGSVDSTLQIAKKFKAKIVKVAENKQNAEYNKGVAVNAARNEILIMIDHDNILPHNHWFKNMIRPLLDDKEIFGTGVLRFHYDTKMNLFDRYSSLLGGTDPVPFFFNKSAHQSYIYNQFHLKASLEREQKNYYTVRLNSEDLPALGGNGSALRRKLLKHTNSSPGYFFHIDIHVDLARKGYLKYAFVKDSTIHLTNNSFIDFLRRRRYFIEKYHFEDHSKRRYSVYNPNKDKFALTLFVIYSISFFWPLVDSIRGYMKVRDLAWFVHPFMCLGIVLVYGITTIREELKNVFLERKSGISYRSQRFRRG